MTADCGVTTGYLATVAAAGQQVGCSDSGGGGALSLSLSLPPPFRRRGDAVFGSLTARARFHCHSPLLGGLSLSSIAVIAAIAVAEKRICGGKPHSENALPSLPFPR